MSKGQKRGPSELRIHTHLRPGGYEPPAGEVVVTEAERAGDWASAEVGFKSPFKRIRPLQLHEKGSPEEIP